MRLCIALTNRCNLECVSCLNRSGPRAEWGLPTATLKEVLRWLGGQETPQVDFSGGEPFIRRDARDLMSYAKEQDITSNVCTNGCIADQRDLDLLASMHKVTVTFYGLEPFHDRVTRVPGSFKRALRTLTLLRGSKTRLRANVVTLAEALPDFPALADQLQEAGADEVKFSIPFPAGRAAGLTSQLVTRDENKELAQSMLTRDGLEIPVSVQGFGHGPFVCQILQKSGLFLASDGAIYPCPLFSYVDGPIGRVSGTGTVDAALHGMDWGKAMEWVERAGENRCPAIDLGLFEDLPDGIVHQGCPPLVERRQM